MTSSGEVHQEPARGAHALRVFAGGLVFLHALYAGAVASALNLVLVVVPLIPALVPRDEGPGPSLWFKSLAEVVRPNYSAHMGYAFAAAALAALVAAISLVAAEISRRRAKRRLEAAAPSGTADRGAFG